MTTSSDQDKIKSFSFAEPFFLDEFSINQAEVLRRAGYEIFEIKNVWREAIEPSLEGSCLEMRTTARFSSSPAFLLRKRIQAEKTGDQGG